AAVAAPPAPETAAAPEVTVQKPTAEPRPKPAPPKSSSPTLDATGSGSEAPKPAQQDAPKPPQAKPDSLEPKGSAPGTATAAETAPAATASPPKAKTKADAGLAALTGGKPKRSRKAAGSGFDALAELEKLRRQTLKPKGASPQKAASSTSSSTSVPREIQRDVKLSLAADDFRRARRFSVTLQVEDADHRVLDQARQLHLDIDDVSSIDQLLLRLNIALRSIP
ncbi:MAG: hypothetical protein AAGN66_30605, partial [Acidobacteriota bacterium]